MFQPADGNLLSKQGLVVEMIQLPGRINRGKCDHAEEYLSAGLWGDQKAVNRCYTLILVFISVVYRNGGTRPTVVLH